QWDVRDPTTDIAAMKSLFPAVIAAAHVLNTGHGLVRELQAALKKIPQYPLKHDRTGKAFIGMSYDENAPIHNTENIGLEVVWPYALIGDAGPLHELGVRTYEDRPNKFQNDWSFDPIQAARLGLAAQIRTALIDLTEKYQQYPSGFAKFVGPEFYIEQIGVVAAALQQALVQDYGGLLRIAPAWPKEWDVDGTVYIQRNSRVDVQVRHGIPVTVVIEAGANGHLSVRNPWPGEPAEVLSSDGQRIARASGTSLLHFATKVGKSYAVQRAASPNARLPFAAVDGIPASSPKSLGIRHIGLQ
ncbi:MAG: glycosyl hydrolase family 95 catalytic domain-containing protein, partial [Bryobacteraceae bacterium]